MRDSSIYGHNGCACLVDNDRFIAIFGHCSLAELYAINCEKSIPLSQDDIDLRNVNSKWLYHDQFRNFIC